MSESTTAVAIVFRIGGAGYALPVEQAREVTHVSHRVRVPFAPAVLWGAINHRGWVYAAIDTPMWATNGAKLFEPTEEARAILLELPEQRMALLVDAIETVGLMSEETNESQETVVRVDGIRVELLDVTSMLIEVNRMIDHVVRSRAIR